MKSKYSFKLILLASLFCLTLKADTLEWFYPTNKITPDLTFEIRDCTNLVARARSMRKMFVHRKKSIDVMKVVFQPLTNFPASSLPNSNGFFTLPITPVPHGSFVVWASNSVGERMSAAVHAQTNPPPPLAIKVADPLMIGTPVLQYHVQ